MDYSIEALLPVVRELTEKYTSKESTSVTYEVAQQLMEAVLYCINENDISDVVIRPGEIYDTTHEMDVKKAYIQGYQLVFQKVIRTKELYEEIIKDFRAYGNRCYYNTIIKEMPMFFQHYDAKFNPQNHILSLDYPTLVTVNEICGIDAIYRYLSYIQLEQTFLNEIPENTIIDILLEYSSEYKELLINICSIVLRNILEYMIGDNTQPSSNKPDTDNIEKKYTGLLKILISQQYKNNQLLFEYLNKAINNLL